MIIFTILALIAIALIAITVLIVSVGGAVGIVLCSDIIVCIAIIVVLMKLIFKKKK